MIIKTLINIIRIPQKCLGALQVPFQVSATMIAALCQLFVRYELLLAMDAESLWRIAVSIALHCLQENDPVEM